MKNQENVLLYKSRTCSLLKLIGSEFTLWMFLYWAAPSLVLIVFIFVSEFLNHYNKMSLLACLKEQRHKTHHIFLLSTNPTTRTKPTNWSWTYQLDKLILGQRPLSKNYYIDDISLCKGLVLEWSNEESDTDTHSFKHLLELQRSDMFLLSDKHGHRFP